MTEPNPVSDEDATVAAEAEDFEPEVFEDDVPLPESSRPDHLDDGVNPGDDEMDA